MHEGVARTYAALGDFDSRDQHCREAEAALAREHDDDDRALIASQIATVPARVCGVGRG